ncbi:MAG TPA: WD40 repeat domain-containing protein, partial [Aggregatilineaceae bacterium]|nr:WD40 repeat domain-containing protein [Aggregatilineaceae bacterium]
QQVTNMSFPSPFEGIPQVPYEPAPDPVATSTDGRWLVRYEVLNQDERRAILHVFDTSQSQPVADIPSDTLSTHYRGLPFFPRFFANGLLFLRENTLYRWEPDHNTETRLLSVDAFADIFLNPTGQYAATSQLLPLESNLSILRFWDLTASPATLLSEYKSNTTDLWHSVAVSPNGQFVAAGGNNSNVRIWDITSSEMPFRDDNSPCETCESPVIDLAYSPDGHYLGGCVNTVGTGHAFLRDAETGKEVATIAGIGGTGYSYWTSVAFNPVANTVAFGGADGTVWLWNIDKLIAAREVQTSSAELSLIGHSGPVIDISFSTDGKQIATASWDNTARVWDSTTGQLLDILEGHTAHVWSAVFFPDGNRLVTSSEDNTVRLWDLRTDTSIILANIDWIVELAFSPAEPSSPDSVLAGLQSDGDFYFFTFMGGELTSLRAVQSDSYKWNWHLAFNQDGTMLATAGQDTVIRLWGVPARQE